MSVCVRGARGGASVLVKVAWCHVPVPLTRGWRQAKKNKPYLMVRNSWGVRKKMKEGVGEKSAAAYLRKKQQRGSGGGKHNG